MSLYHPVRIMQVSYADMPLFFFNDTATTEIYTLSLHDALPISKTGATIVFSTGGPIPTAALSGTALLWVEQRLLTQDRKSTRLNSSHSQISYAVFCLKKKKTLLLTQADRLTADLTCRRDLQPDT